MSDSPARDGKQNASQTQDNIRDSTSRLIKEALSDGIISDTFDDVISRLVKRLEGFSKDLSVDYHIVLMDKKQNVRYSIIEGKNPNFAYKDLDYGIVGSLFKQRRKKYQSMFVQFRFSKESPSVVYYETGSHRINKMEPNVITEVLGGNIDSVWNPDKGDFAIAASLIKNPANEIIGACSIDFSASEQFPDFSFRKNEVEEIFDILYTFKLIFEKLIYMNPSEPSPVEESIKKVIKIIEGANVDE